MAAAEFPDGAPGGPVPVVVTGADLPGGLGLARALRGLGVRVHGLATDPLSPCCRSFAWTEIVTVADDSKQAWLDALLEIAARHPRQVLFPAQDTLVDIISRHRTDLEEHYLLVLPDHATVQLLGDKSAFAPWAQAIGFPVPRTQVVSSPAEFDVALAGMTFPAVLKPFTRNRRWRAVCGRNKANRLESAADVANLPLSLHTLRRLAGRVPGRNARARVGSARGGGGLSPHR